MRLKGQIFSIDFVIAVAILTIAIGITLQTVDTFQKRMMIIEQTHTNHADVAAQYFLYNASGFEPATPYCYVYSNGTGTCSAFSCSKNTFAATRLTACENTAVPTIEPCAVTIMTCE